MTKTNQHLSSNQVAEIILAEPRGFCAGVNRAIEIVDLALERYGAPLYVRHEIVHNHHVVNDFKSRGVIFVERLEEVPDGALVIFSAHGTSPAVIQSASSRGLKFIDAVCPLVTKVHLEIARAIKDGKKVIYIGHRGHQEVLGAMGYASANLDQGNKNHQVQGYIFGGINRGC
jgi:4-hydroxy-3-methylbut-2-enyl diphosphate reductase